MKIHVVYGSWFGSTDTTGRINQLYASTDEKAARDFMENPEVKALCAENALTRYRVWMDTIEVPGRITVPTPMGNIVVEETDPAYPGVNIDIVSGDQSVAIATVEYNPEKGDIVEWLFGDASRDEYTEELSIKGLKEALKKD